MPHHTVERCTRPTNAPLNPRLVKAFQDVPLVFLPFKADFKRREEEITRRMFHVEHKNFLDRELSSAVRIATRASSR